MYNCQTKEEMLEIVKEKNVSFLQFWFTDVLGVQKVFSVTPSELEEGLTEERKAPFIKNGFPSD